MLLTLVFALLTGCNTSPPKFDMPTVPLPNRFREAGGVAPQTPAVPAPGSWAGARNPSGGSVEKARNGWWRDFESPELNSLFDRALANNPDMRVAVHRIVQAKARLDQARAARLPSVSAPLVVADQSAGSGTVGAAPTGSASSSSGASQQTWQAGVRADWRLDLWGEQSALAESAEYQLRRAVYERENVERQLAAALAGAYVDYLSLNDRRGIAIRTDSVQGETLATIENRVEAGDATMADLEQQRATIYSVRATLPVLEQQRMEALSNIAYLVGTVPGNLRLSDRGLDSLAIPATTTGVPSELLLRRPDVRMAEAELRAANADVDVARSRLLPPVDLMAQLGRSGATPAQLLQPQTLFWGLVNSLTVSIFDGGRKKLDEVYSRSVREEMVEAYIRSVHQAVKEVEGALTTLRLSKQRLGAQNDTLEASRRAWEIADRVYRIGGVDYQTLLDTQRTYHRYTDDYAQARAGYMRAYVSLLQSLGGELAPDDGKPAKAGTPAAKLVRTSAGPPTEAAARCQESASKSESPRASITAPCSRR